MKETERSHGGDSCNVGISANSAVSAGNIEAEGYYVVECLGPDGKPKWRDAIKNAVTQEGKVTALHNNFKASAFTQQSYLGLITNTNYTTAPGTGNTAASLSTASAAGNGWQEAPASVIANRGTPAWGTSTGSGGNASLSTGSAVSFSVLAAATLKGCFVVQKDLSGTAPSNVPGNTAGVLYSAGLFTGGDKAVGAGDTLNVSYTATLT